MYGAVKDKAALKSELERRNLNESKVFSLWQSS